MRTSPPHSSQTSISILKTRLNLCAQVIAARFSAGVWSASSAELLLDDYRALPSHDDDWVAQRVLCTVVELHGYLDTLVGTGLVVWDAPHWRPLAPHLVSVHPRFDQDGLIHDLASIVTTCKSDVGMLTFAHGTAEQLAEVKQILMDARSRIRDALNDRSTKTQLFCINTNLWVLHGEDGVPPRLREES